VIEDISGRLFGHLTALRRIESDRHSHARWLCRCDCGTEKGILYAQLMRGTTHSCGCHKAQLLKDKKTKHGKSNSKIYSIWCNMIRRCYDSRVSNYHRYGGRGIEICERWLRFEHFLADMGDPPDGMSLDRVNNDGNYEPSNCRWATREQQSKNSTRPILLSFRGLTMNVTEWATHLGISQGTLSERLKTWPFEEALSRGRSYRWSRKARLRYN